MSSFSTTIRKQNLISVNEKKTIHTQQNVKYKSFWVG